MGGISFERLPDESALAWRAFRAYRDLGLTRSVKRACEALDEPSVYVQQMYAWSTKNQWVNRAREWDESQEESARLASEQYMPIWEQKRQQSLENNLLFAERIRTRILEMMDRPLTREIIKEVNGKEITYVEPAGWNWNTIINGARAVAELEAETIAEGMMEVMSGTFDAATATEDELREYVTKRLPGGNRR